jgi:hypothetical protein
MASRSAFLKENFVVVLGLALPLLLVAVFALARGISTATVEPPQYKAVYAQSNYSNGKFRYAVGPDKKLTVTYDAPKYHGEPPRSVVSTSTTIYVADAKTGQVSKYTYNVANSYAEGVTQVPTKDLTVQIETEGMTAPDGYIYSRDTDHYSRGIVPEIFGYGRSYRDSHVISKSGRSFTIETANPYDNIDFIGWTKD